MQDEEIRKISRNLNFLTYQFQMLAVTMSYVINHESYSHVSSFSIEHANQLGFYVHGRAFGLILTAVRDGEKLIGKAEVVTYSRKREIESRTDSLTIDHTGLVRLLGTEAPGLQIEKNRHQIFAHILKSPHADLFED